MIRALIRDHAGVHALEPTAENLQMVLGEPGCTLWLDLPGGTPDEFGPVGATFGFHPLAIEDALGRAEHPKIDDYGPYLHLVAHACDCDIAAAEVKVQELDLFLGANYLVTFHHEPLHCLSLLWERALRDERYLQHGPDGLAHAALDILVDDLLPVLERLDAAIEDLEEEVLADPTQKTLTRILDLKRAMLHLRRTVVPQREVIYRLSRDESPLVQARNRLYFRDVYDHLVRVTDINESLRDLVAGALEIYLSVVSNRMNEVMKVLTLVTTIFMPLTLLAGFYGMNFRFMPELEWRYGHLAVLAAMLAIAGGMACWFRRRGWM